MEQNNQRNSRKRLNSLILLVAFTAVMLIVSTYAWFSTQKNVTIGGLKGQVNVAEGLQISLDAKTWSNSINLGDFTPDEDSEGEWTSDLYLPGATFQKPYQVGVNDRDEPIMAANITPDEMKPVSTIAGSNDGIGQDALSMYWGDLSEGVKLSEIKKMDEEAESGYFAFDVFLMNSSAADKTVDKLQLEPNSSVKVNDGKDKTGLQNTVRVGFALYENANDTTVTVNNTPSTEQIIAGTANNKKIKDVAIWEPNSDAHVQTIVDSNNSITWSQADLIAYGFEEDGYSLGAKAAKFTSTPTTGVAKIPTYALTSGGTTVPTTIADIYDWATPSEGLAKQVTLQTTAEYTVSDGNTSLPESNDGMKEGDPLQLISIKKSEEASPEDTDFEITAGQYHKIRIYVWLEGQDVDCTNYASLGGGLTLDIGFSKPGSTNNS